MQTTYWTNSKKQAIFGYTDSDFAGDETNRKSTRGYGFVGAITVSSKMLSIVADPSQECCITW